MALGDLAAQIAQFCEEGGEIPQELANAWGEQQMLRADASHACKSIRAEEASGDSQEREEQEENVSSRRPRKIPFVPVNDRVPPCIVPDSYVLDPTKVQILDLLEKAGKRVPKQGKVAQRGLVVCCSAEDIIPPGTKLHEGVWVRYSDLMVPEAQYKACLPDTAAAVVGALELGEGSKIPVLMPIQKGGPYIPSFIFRIHGGNVNWISWEDIYPEDLCHKDTPFLCLKE